MQDGLRLAAQRSRYVGCIAPVNRSQLRYLLEDVVVVGREQRYAELGKRPGHLGVQCLESSRCVTEPALQFATRRAAEPHRDLLGHAEKGLAIALLAELEYAAPSVGPLDGQIGENLCTALDPVLQ